MMNRSRATSRVLYVGVVISFILLTIGLGQAMLNSTDFSRIRPSDLRSLRSLPGRLDAALTIHVGLLALMATPFARMLVLLAEFLRNREYAFVILSIGVIFLLIISIATGLR